MKVLTGPEWLFEQMNNLPNEKLTALLKPVRDKNNRPIIATSVLNDPDWEFLEKITSPQGATKHIREWLSLIDYEPKEINI